jgi:hypothetical protein
MIFRWSCFSTSAGKTAFHASISRDFSGLTQSRSVLRGIPRSFFDVAARGFPALTADAASFTDSGDHCVLSPLHVFLMMSEEYSQIFKPKILKEKMKNIREE